MEQSLWKLCFYAVIEEFRRRITKSKAAGPPGEESLRKVRPPRCRSTLAAALHACSLQCAGLAATYMHLGCRQPVGWKCMCGLWRLSMLPAAQTSGALLKFLREGAIFYGLLATKLQAAYGSVGFPLAFADQVLLHKRTGFFHCCLLVCTPGPCIALCMACGSAAITGCPHLCTSSCRVTACCKTLQRPRV